MALQDTLSQKTYQWKRKIFDFNIDYLGNEVQGISFSKEVINHYGDTEYTITKDNIITCIIDYPGQELPLTSDNANQGESHFHLYDVLPIEGYFKFEDDIQIDDIIAHKVYVPNGDPQLITLQVKEPITRSSKYVTWRKFHLSPYTLHLENYPELRSILENYLLMAD